MSAEATLSPKLCRRCGSPLPPKARGSVCPACMAAAAASFARAPVAEVNPPAPQPVVFGDYLLEEELAHGGMGVVYRARQLSLNRTVAVKLLLLGKYSSMESQQRFRREAQSAALLRHPGILQVHEVGETDGQPFIAMEYVSGGSLAEKLREHPLPPRQAAEIVRDVAAALQHAHDHGVLHRDVKPSNILFDARGSVRIGDFGLAKMLDGTTDVTLSGHLAGTPNYIAPELAGSHPDKTSVTSDVYSLGAVFYECLTGRPPFLADSLQQTLLAILEKDPVPLRALNARVPADLETICLKALAREPAQRLASAQAFADELDRWLRGEPILTRPASPLERLVKWTRRRPALAALSALTILAVSAAIVILGIANHRVAAQREVAEARSEESRSRLVRMHTAAGTRLVQDGRAYDSLLHFAAALELDAAHPDNEERHRRRLGAVLATSPELVALYDSGGVWNGTFSPDGTALLCGSDDGSAVLRSLTDQRELLRLEPAEEAIRYVFFDPAGRPATADDKGRVQFYSRDGKPEGPLLPVAVTASEVNTWLDRFHFSADGSRFVAVLPDGGAQIYSLPDGNPVGPVQAAGSTLLRVRLTPDGSSVGVCGEFGAQVLEAESGALRLTVESAPVRLFASSEDAATIATVGLRDGLLRLRQASSAALLCDPVAIYSPYECRFRPDGKSLIIATPDRATLLDTATGRPAGAAMLHSSHVLSMDTDKSGRVLVTGSFDGTARVWQLPAGLPLTPWIAAGRFPCDASLCPNHRHFLTYSGGFVKLWRLPDDAGSGLRFSHPGLKASGLSADGSRLLTAGKKQLLVRDFHNGGVLMEKALAAPVQLAAVSADGNWIATLTNDRALQFWNVATGSEPEEIMLDFAAVSLALSPDGQQLLAVGTAGEAVMIQRGTGAPKSRTPAPGFAVLAAGFSQDGRFAYLTGQEAVAWIHDIRANRTVFESAPVTGFRAGFVSFSPDGRVAAVRSSADPFSVELIDLTTGRPLAAPAIHRGLMPPLIRRDGSLASAPDSENQIRVPQLIAEKRPIHAAAFNPDESLVALLLDDGSVSVRETATGEAVLPPVALRSEPVQLIWHPGGHHLILVTGEGAAVINLTPATGSARELRRHAELLSTQQLSDDLTFTPLSEEEIAGRWRSESGAR